MTSTRRRRPWRAQVVVLALAAVGLGGCLFYEQPLTTRLTCFEPAEGQSFGRSRQLDVDVQQFSRPGLYAAEEVAVILGARGVDEHAEHIARVVGPCGETDLFVRVDEVEHCITVVAHLWWDHVCRPFDGPTTFPLDLGEMAGHAVLVVVGGDVDHVVVDDAEGFRIGGFPIDGHIVLSSPHPLGEPLPIRLGEAGPGA